VTTTPADDVLAALLAEPALAVAPRLLGSVFWSGGVGVRLTEVEAYHGQGQDPGSHAHRGPSARNGSMFEGGGTLYVYLSYGIHRCVNIVCGPEGYASGVLLRAGEVVAGVDEARTRRSTSRTPSDLARGPGRLGSALGIELDDDGSRVVADTPGQEARFRLRLPSAPVGPIAAGPRVGVSGHAGGDAYPWRFSLEGDRTVSPYRAAVSRGRGGA
jgi:DNA-3-methyladenine glycosylase